MQIAVFEISTFLIIICAIYKWHINKKFSKPVSISLSIIISIILISTIYQSFFLIQLPEYAIYIEILILIFSIIYVFKKIDIPMLIRVFINYLSHNKLIFILLMIVFGYLFLQVLILKPNNIDSHIYTLSRILLFQQEQSLFLENASNYHQAVFPLGFDILNYKFLRHNIQNGIGFFSFISYVGLFFSSYSLSRLYYNKSISILSALIIISMPQVVFAATTPKSDLILGFLACLIIRLTLSPKSDNKENIYIITMLAFGLSCKLTFLAFIMIYLLLTAFFFRQKLKISFKEYRLYKFSIFCIIIFTFFISGLWQMIWNHLYWGGYCGPKPLVAPASNTDGMIGGIANCVRYVFESFHIPGYFYLFLKNTLNLDIMSYSQLLYDTIFFPIFLNKGIANGYSFEINWFQNEHSWYGPFGFIFFPILIVSIVKGTKPIKFASVITIFIFLCISFRLSWSPMKDRYFIFMYSSSVLLYAQCLNFIPYKSSKLSFKLISLISVILLLLSVFLNNTKPLFNFLSLRIDKMFYSSFAQGNNVWHKTNYGEKSYWGNTSVDTILDDLHTCKISLYQVGQRRTFSFLMQRPDCHFTPMERRINDPVNNRIKKPVYQKKLEEDFDYILIVGNTFRFIDSSNIEISGQEINLGGKKAQLIKSINEFDIKLLKLS